MGKSWRRTKAPWRRSWRRACSWHVQRLKWRSEWARVPIDLLPGFDAAARAVAAAGLPADAPMRAVWCLVAALVAAKGALPWARTLLRLTGHFRCGQCETVLPITALLNKLCAEDSGSPQDIDPAVIADEAGFKPTPGVTLLPSDFPLRPVVVPDGLRPPAATEALVVMPGPGGSRVPWLPGAVEGSLAGRSARRPHRARGRRPHRRCPAV